MRTTSQCLLIVLGIFVVASALLFGVSRSRGTSNTRAMEQAAASGLHDLYAELHRKPRGGDLSRWFSAEELTYTLLSDGWYKAHFPSFITPDRIFLPPGKVGAGTTGLICIVRVSEKVLVGIDGL